VTISQPPTSSGEQHLDSLHGIYVRDERGENRGLISAARSDLQHSRRRRLCNHGLCHQRHDERLRYRLPHPDWQGDVVIGATRKRLADEYVTRYIENGIEHALIGNSLIAQAGHETPARAHRRHSGSFEREVHDSSISEEPALDRTQGLMPRKVDLQGRHGNATGAHRMTRTAGRAPHGAHRIRSRFTDPHPARPRAVRPDGSDLRDGRSRAQPDPRDSGNQAGGEKPAKRPELGIRDAHFKCHPVTRNEPGSRTTFRPGLARISHRVTAVDADPTQAHRLLRKTARSAASNAA